jgi:hypothetical protein
MVGFAKRQVERLSHEVVEQHDNPAFVIIEDGCGSSGVMYCEEL